jgi:TolA-binding protein
MREVPMIRKLIIVIGMLALCITAAPAQEKKGSGVSSWFKELQKKIDIISPRKSLSVGTGVAGVRGAKDDNGRSKLYWKGKRGEEPVTEAELAEFKEGLAFVEAGKKAEAIHEFEEFLQQHPDSALVPDAKKSLDIMKAEAKPQDTPATAQQK